MGLLAGTADMIRRGRRAIKRELEARGHPLSLYRKMHHGQKPIIILPFHHKLFGKWHAKIHKIIEKNTHILRHPIQDTIGSPQIHWAYDMPISIKYRCKYGRLGVKSVGQSVKNTLKGRQTVADS